MKKFKTAVVGAFALALAATCLAACENDSDREEPKTLAAPEIVLNDDFSVSWQAVAEATSYVVNVNGDDLKAQEALTFNALTAVNSYTVKQTMKKQWQSAEITIFSFEQTDVVSTSVTGGGKALSNKLDGSFDGISKDDIFD